MYDRKTIETRLTNLARRIFAQYQSQLEPEYVHQLDEAISICETYQQDMGVLEQKSLLLKCTIDNAR